MNEAYLELRKNFGMIRSSKSFDLRTRKALPCGNQVMRSWNSGDERISWSFDGKVALGLDAAELGINSFGGGE